jgi:hypothetical protein
MQFRYQNEHIFRGEINMLKKTQAILVLAIALVAQTSSAYLTPGPSQGGRPAPYPGDPYPGNPYPDPGNPYPGNPYPGNPPPNLDPYPPQQPPSYPPPQYPPHNPPPNYGSCYRDLCVGTRVYNIQRSYREAEIVGIEHQGTYVLRFIDNGGVGGNWSREDLAVKQGCSGDLCVGTTIYNTQRNYRQAQIVGIQLGGKYVLRFLDNNGVGGNWDRADLAVMHGCGYNYCVGQYALNAQRNYRQVQVVAIQHDRRYVLRFLDNGGVGGNWTDSDLVRQ